MRSAHGEHALFTPDDFRRLLDEAAIGVFLSTFETQGLALAEAWSMDVPTVVWDPRGTAEWRGRSFPVRLLGAVSDAGHRTPVADDRPSSNRFCAGARGAVRVPPARSGCSRT